MFVICRTVRVSTHIRLSFPKAKHKRPNVHSIAVGRLAESALLCLLFFFEFQLLCHFFFLCFFAVTVLVLTVVKGASTFCTGNEEAASAAGFFISPFFVCSPPSSLVSVGALKTSIQLLFFLLSFLLFQSFVFILFVVSSLWLPRFGAALLFFLCYSSPLLFFCNDIALFPLLLHFFFMFNFTTTTTPKRTVKITETKLAETVLQQQQQQKENIKS